MSLRRILCPDVRVLDEILALEAALVGISSYGKLATRTS